MGESLWLSFSFRQRVSKVVYRVPTEWDLSFTQCMRRDLKPVSPPYVTKYFRSRMRVATKGPTSLNRPSYPPYPVDSFGPYNESLRVPYLRPVIFTVVDR